MSEWCVGALLEQLYRLSRRLPPSEGLRPRQRGRSKVIRAMTIGRTSSISSSLLAGTDVHLSCIINFFSL